MKNQPPPKRLIYFFVSFLFAAFAEAALVVPELLEVNEES
jgi:hypothetical protein